MIQSFRFEREADGKTREEVREGNSTTLTVFDGSRVWVYRSANNTYASRPATRFLTDSSGFASLEFGRQPANVLSANIQGHETLMFGGKPELCYVVIAQYKGTPGDETVPGLLRYSARKVWIGQNTGLVLRDNWEFESVYGGVSTRVSNVYDYSNIETDVPLAADLFSFSPPRGSVASAPVQFQPPTAVPGAVPKLAADATPLPIPTADSGFAISFDATNTGVRWAITGRVRGRATSDGKTIDISVEECEILRPGTFDNPQEIRRITAGIIRHGDSENVRWVMFADSHPVNPHSKAK